MWRLCQNSLTSSRNLKAFQFIKERLKRAKEETIKLNETISILEEKIKYYKGRDDEYFVNREKLVKIYELNIIDSDGELKEKFIQNIF